jgi:GNAT superfamily N-acetyltransferase
MRIATLAQHPEHVCTVAGWIFHEWGSRLPGVNLEKIETQFQTHLNRNRIPLTLLAFEGDLPVGTSSLVLQDISSRPELSPWVAGVYVLPEHRGKGIGSRLVGLAEQVARRLGVKQLYLFTHDRAGFYANFGWRALEQTQYHRLPVVIMCKKL